MWTWLLRLAGWSAGIFALLKLAQTTGAVSYTAIFQATLDSLKNILDFGFVLTPIELAFILPALDFLREFGWHIPPLQSHWQNAFVLTWLGCAALARNLALADDKIAGLIFGFVINLLLCLAAGTTPPNNVSVLAWPVAGYFFFIATYFAGFVLRTGGFALAIFCLALGYFDPIRDRDWLFWLAFVVGFSGLLFTAIGIGTETGGLVQRIQNPLSATGLDIVGTLLGAIALATIFADPPLF